MTSPSSPYKPGFYDYQKHGVTQGLLQTWMSCREKARWTLEGWSYKKPSMALTHGNIIHGVLETVYTMIRDKKLKHPPDMNLIKKLTKPVELQWHKENLNASRSALQDLEMSLLLAEVTLPAYFSYWWKDDFIKTKWIALELKFEIPYTTKDGRKTVVRGKMDGVLGKEKVRLFETKNKTLINLDDMVDTLWFDFQNSLYLWALKRLYGKPLSGVTYNIIRRTSLRKTDGETLKEYGNRLDKDIKKRPDFYFNRLQIAVNPVDVKKFEDELEGIITDFLNWCDGKAPHYRSPARCIGKYGRCSYLDLCSRKDFSNYTKRKVVFKELEDF